jgi:hypothetical protein
MGGALAFEIMTLHHTLETFANTEKQLKGC